MGKKDVGLVTADSRLNRLGVLSTEESEPLNLDNSNPDYSNCAFRLVSKLNYRAAADADHIKKQYDEVRDRPELKERHEYQLALAKVISQQPNYTQLLDLCLCFERRHRRNFFE